MNNHTPSTSRPLASLRDARLLIEAIGTELPSIATSLREQDALLFLLENWAAGSVPTLAALTARLGASSPRDFLRRLARDGALVTEPDLDCAAEPRIGLDPGFAARILRKAMDAAGAQPPQTFIRAVPCDIAPEDADTDHLAALYADWMHAGPGGLPYYHPDMLDRARRIVGAECVHLFDISSENPNEYRAEVVGRCAQPFLEMFRAGDARLGAITNPIFRDFQTSGYHAAKMAGWATAQNVVCRTAFGRELVFRRIILPLTRNGSAPDLFLVGIHDRSSNALD